jgi:hypothetical protein
MFVNYICSEVQYYYCTATTILLSGVRFVSGPAAAAAVRVLILCGTDAGPEPGQTFPSSLWSKIHASYA